MMRPENAPKKKSRKGLIIGLSVGGGILLAAVIAIIVVFAWFRSHAVLLDDAGSQEAEVTIEDVTPPAGTAPSITVDFGDIAPSTATPAGPGIGNNGVTEREESSAASQKSSQESSQQSSAGSPGTVTMNDKGCLWAINYDDETSQCHWYNDLGQVVCIGYLKDTHNTNQYTKAEFLEYDEHGNVIRKETDYYDDGRITDYEVMYYTNYYTGQRLDEVYTEKYKYDFDKADWILTYTLDELYNEDGHVFYSNSIFYHMVNGGPEEDFSTTTYREYDNPDGSLSYMESYYNPVPDDPSNRQLESVNFRDYRGSGIYEMSYYDGNYEPSGHGKEVFDANGRLVSTEYALENGEYSEFVEYVYGDSGKLVWKRVTTNDRGRETVRTAEYSYEPLENLLYPY